MITDQKMVGLSTISRGPGVTLRAIRAPSKIAVVPEPGIPSVSSGTNDSARIRHYSDIKSKSNNCNKSLKQYTQLIKGILS